MLALFPPVTNQDNLLPYYDRPEVRDRVLLAAKARLLYNAPAARLARYYQVSERTIRHWVQLALTWEGDDADALRRVAPQHRDAS